METNVPYAALELMSEKMSQTIKRLIVIIVVLIFALLGTNIAWIIYESQFDTAICDIQNEDGTANYIGRDGEINNGENSSQEEN